MDFLKEGVRVFSQALMEVEVAQHPGAERYERSGERHGQRNGYRERSWDTRVGTLDLKVPRVRDGSYFPSLLEPRKRAERALVAVVREAYVQGVSTRRVDDLVRLEFLVAASDANAQLTPLDALEVALNERDQESIQPDVSQSGTRLTPPRQGVARRPGQQHRCGSSYTL